jgi:hypothetical protein
MQTLGEKEDSQSNTLCQFCLMRRGASVAFTTKEALEKHLSRNHPGLSEKDLDPEQIEYEYERRLTHWRKQEKIKSGLKKYLNHKQQGVMQAEEKIN